MAYWWRSKGNYLRRSNIEAFAQADMNTESVSAVEKNISRRKKKVIVERKLKAKKKQARAAKLRSIQMLRNGYEITSALCRVGHRPMRVKLTQGTRS